MNRRNFVGWGVQGVLVSSAGAQVLGRPQAALPDQQAARTTNIEYEDIPGRPRSSAGFAQHNDFVYWVGGHLGEFHYYDRGNISRQAHRLNLKTGEWTQIADFPVRAQGFRMCGYGDGIFAFGGFVYEGDGEWPVRSTNIVRRYDIGKNIWEDAARLSAPRSSNVLGVVGDLVYLIGGWDGWSKPSQDESDPWRSKPDTFHDTIEIFDLAARKTAEVIPLGIPKRRALAAVTRGSEITIAGGLGPRGFWDTLTEVMTFDTKSRRWTKLFDMPQGLFSPGLAWPAHIPLIIGGLFVDKQYNSKEYNTIATFDPHAGGGWKELAHLRSTRTFAESAVYEDRLVVFGGHSGTFPTAEVQSFDANNPSDASRLRRTLMQRIDQVM